MRLPRAVYNFSAGLEVVTGLTICAIPNVVMNLLYGSPLIVQGESLARLYGIALISFGVASVGDFNEKARNKSAELGLTIYNLLAGVLLIHTAAIGTAQGSLIWPGGIFHLILGVVMVIDQVNNKLN